LNDKDFIRKRKLGFTDLIIYQLRSVSKSLSVSLDDYLNETDKKVNGYSKQAYSKARMKIKHQGYIELNDDIQEEFYKKSYKTYNGYRLLGIDGSKIELPHSEEIAEYFGQMNNDDKMINVSWSTVVYDLLNNQAVDASLNKYGESERKYAIDQFRELKRRGKQRKDIVVADRGFPSLELFVEFKEMNYDFVIRYNGEYFLKETQVLVDGGKKDIEIEIDLRQGNKRSENKSIRALLSQGAPKRIKLRAVRIELDNGKQEYLITSLLNKKKFKAKDFKEIYRLRWNHETYYNYQKNVIEVERFTGKTVESILQDYHSRVLVGNIHSMILTEAEEGIKEEVSENPNLKYAEYKTNRAVSYGIMRPRIYRMLSEENYDWEKEYDELVEIAKKYKLPVKPNRSYPRKKKGNLKYPLNTRRIN
jgi:hypothetical protein